MHGLLSRVLEFCHCEYLVFFGSVQEGDTVLTPIAAVGAPAALGDALPHFNWRKASLPLESFDVRTRSVADWDAAEFYNGIRGQNSELFADAACFLPFCRGRQYRGLLALGPFVEPVYPGDEYRFIAEIATVVGNYALVVLESLYLKGKTVMLETRTKLASHQLKTGLVPLTMNSSWISSLCRKKWSDGVQRQTAELAEAITRRALRLRDQANDTLQRDSLTHLEIESRVLEEELKLERYPLAVLVSNCANGFVDRAEVGGHHLLVDSSVEELPLVNVDLVRMGTAMGNLLENAIKYSAVGTEIIVRGRWDFIAPGKM